MKLIEFLGMPRAGKTTQINRLKTRLEQEGYTVALLTDRVRAEHIKTPVSLGMAYTLVFFSQAIEFYFEHANTADYILIDRGFVDARVWADTRRRLGEFTDAQAAAFQECFETFEPLVDKSVFFQLSTDVALARHEATGENQAVDEVAMNRKWLETIEASYRENEDLFKGALKIDGLQTPDVAEAAIWEFIS